MGVLQKLGLTPTRYYSNPQWNGLPWELSGPVLDSLALSTRSMSVEQLWREQPHLRTVTTFIARSIATVKLHAYERNDDDGRVRLKTGKLAQMLRTTSANTLTYDLLYRALMDLCLYDEFFWIVGGDVGDRYEIRPLPVRWVRTREWSDRWTLEAVWIDDDENTGHPIRVPADRLIHVHGYNPTTLKEGTSPVMALRDVLAEQLESAAYRTQLWRKGPRLGGFISRPKDAPQWSNEARGRFKRDFQAVYSGRGSGAGGVPVLEDGMTFSAVHLSAKDEQLVETAKLSLATVAQVYHINPTMVGQLDNANYSNVREFRKSLYGDNLAPYIRVIEDVFNSILLPRLGEDNERVYVEFNLDEKLRANMEERASILTSSAGRPWLTVNEVRAMENLPAVDGGDALAMPLNTGVAGEDTEEEGSTTARPPQEYDPDPAGNEEAPL